LPGDALLATFVVSKATGVIRVWEIFFSEVVEVLLDAGDAGLFFIGIASRQQVQRRSAAQMPMPIWTPVELISRCRSLGLCASCFEFRVFRSAIIESLF